MTKEIIQQRDYFVAVGLFNQPELYSVLCIDQCTLQYCVRLLYSVCTQDIFVYSDTRMAYSGLCIDLETDMDLTVYSIQTSVHCNIVSGFLLAIYETVYTAYL